MGTNDVTVREAVEPDIAAFARFMQETWRESGPDAPGFAGATDEVIAEITAPDAIQARIGGPDRRIYLAWRQDDVIGFAATRRIDADSIELAGIIVSPSAAGHGVGTALVDAAVDAAVSGGYSSMIVRTETTNETALGFYEARGFTRSHVGTEQVDDQSIEVWELVRTLAR